MRRLIKGIALLLVLCLLLPILSGCWGYHDVDDLFIVMGGYLDRDPITNEFTITSEIMKPKGRNEGQMAVQVVSGKGDTVFAAIRDSLISAGGRLYWGHTQIWVISRRLAENGIVASLDMISRGMEMRTDTNVLIFDGDSMKELVEVHSESELHDSMGQHINDMIREYQRSGAFIMTPIWRVLGELSSAEKALTLPLLEVYMDEGKTQMDVKGIAVFSGTEMVGYIDRDYGKFLYGYRGDIKTEYLLYLPEINDLPATSLEMISTEYKTTISEGEKGLEAKIRCDITANLASFISEKDFLEINTLVFIEREYERYIREEFLQMVREVQSKYGVDIFGFGEKVHIQLPDYWQKVKGNWNAAFRSMDVDIEPHVKITMTGLAHKSLVGAGEK